MVPSCRSFCVASRSGRMSDCLRDGFDFEARLAKGKATLVTAFWPTAVRWGADSRYTNSFSLSTIHKRFAQIQLPLVAIILTLRCSTSKMS